MRVATVVAVVVLSVGCTFVGSEELPESCTVPATQEKCDLPILDMQNEKDVFAFTYQHKGVKFLFQNRQSIALILLDSCFDLYFEVSE